MTLSIVQVSSAFGFFVSLDERSGPSQPKGDEESVVVCYSPLAVAVDNSGTSSPPPPTRPKGEEVVVPTPRYSIGVAVDDDVSSNKAPPTSPTLAVHSS
eukprot:CAMPEP_0201871984 /NCGR_PEP_ID=MMETSP0902-20130614/4786_1 /ASSEMBLY_ACC=CAM_ASM_000551 /TAXON_ID=420261 /ORGANISM="Thalassiosira antarctica, Strain CCMP982" /LENGTH=98 /DNA_ID=CAMNT_0048398137 /DNA_START=982 /DNA_END=1278 /DNA_ORIENTATION=+